MPVAIVTGIFVLIIRFALFKYTKTKHVTIFYVNY